MTPIETWISEMYWSAAIVDVTVDVHECGRRASCLICYKDLFPEVESHQMIDCHFTAPVAQIVVLAEGYSPEGEVLGCDGEWWHVCDCCIDDARDIMLTRDISACKRWATSLSDDGDRSAATGLLDGLEKWRAAREAIGA